MNKVLNTEADVKSMINILLNQVLDKENYELRVEGAIHFDECEPTEEGYNIGNFTFLPWGADAFQVMQELIERTVSPGYISIELTVHNMQQPIQETEDLSEFTEDNVRANFNHSFRQLDEAKSAGSVYVGDNGAYILQYLDVDVHEIDGLIAYWDVAYPSASKHINRTERSLELHIV